MHALNHLVLVACLFICAFAIDDQVKQANEYIDNFIEASTNDTEAFIDPLPLEEIGNNFERLVGFVKVVGEAKLYDGKIYGLSSLQRKGDAVVIDLEDFLIISCQMTFKKIHATYKGALLVNSLGPKIDVNAKIGSSNVNMFLMAPPEGGNATLASLTINKLKDIRISIWGLGPWGWAASLVSSFALNALEKPVAKAASLKLFEYFSKAVEKVPYPGSASE